MAYDRDDQTTFLVVPLSQHQLKCAARLGGLEINLATDLRDCCVHEVERVQDYARYGALEAIRESFERDCPARYPDDVLNNLWDHCTVTGTATGFLGSRWGVV